MLYKNMDDCCDTITGKTCPFKDDYCFEGWRTSQLDPVCVTFEDDTDVEVEYRKYCEQQEAWERQEDLKIRKAREKEEKNKIRHAKAQATKNHVRLETLEIRRLKKYIQRTECAKESALSLREVINTANRVFGYPERPAPDFTEINFEIEKAQKRISELEQIKKDKIKAYKALTNGAEE